MPNVCLRLTASSDDARAMINALQSLDDIEHVEEIHDLMPHMDDEDSSSAGLPDDMGPGIHDIEVEAPDEHSAARVKRMAEKVANELNLRSKLWTNFSPRRATFIKGTVAKRVGGQKVPHG